MYGPAFWDRLAEQAYQSATNAVVCQSGRSQQELHAVLHCRSGPQTRPRGQNADMANAPIWLTGDPEADNLLSEDDNALLIAMILDQQVPMEKAFSGPLVIAQRMGGRLDVAAIATMPEEEFIALCAQRPAIHRFPAAMAKRIHQVCGVLSDNYEGQASNVWRDVATGEELRQALAALPGFGNEKAAIFTAVLGKRRGIQPPGWREAAGGFGEEGSYRSVADIVDADSLARVRDTKRATKAAKKAAG
jgi:uncharacterized HhH-GPD family protein